MAVPDRARPYVRRFNRVARSCAERVPPFVVVHNVGRKTGRQYRTPVVAFAGHDEEGGRVVATPLVWGRDAGWCVNIRAAGAYTLTRRRPDYRVDHLRIVDPEVAARLVGGGARLTNAVVRPDEWIVGRLGTPVAA
jgi:deazaflavin-dependent oxidoreductase (nitroreductase family)